MRGRRAPPEDGATSRSPTRHGPGPAQPALATPSPKPASQPPPATRPLPATAGGPGGGGPRLRSDAPPGRPALHLFDGLAAGGGLDSERPPPDPLALVGGAGGQLRRPAGQRHGGGPENPEHPPPRGPAVAPWHRGLPDAGGGNRRRQPQPRRQPPGPPPPQGHLEIGQRPLHRL